MKNWAVLVTVVLALTACGKSLQVKSKPEGQLDVSNKETGTKIEPKDRQVKSKPEGQLDVSNKETGTKIEPKDRQNNTPGVNGQAGEEGKKDVVKKESLTSGEADVTDLKKNIDGELTLFSKRDYFDLKDLLPFLNSDQKEQNRIRGVNVPSEKNPLEFVRASNLVFRAVKRIPEASKIKEILDFKLVLKGFSKYSSSRTDLATLRDQLLCMYGEAKSYQCVGDEKRIPTEGRNPTLFNDVKFSGIGFSAVLNELRSAGGEKDYLATLQKDESGERGELTLDLIQLYGLSKYSAQEKVNFIFGNSLPYAENHYRKFRFVMGNNVYFQSGELILTYRTDVDSTAQAESIGQVHGGDPDMEAMEFQDSHVSESENQGSGNQGSGNAQNRQGNDSGDFNAKVLYGAVQSNPQELKFETQKNRRNKVIGYRLDRNSSGKIHGIANGLLPFKAQISALRIAVQTDQSQNDNVSQNLWRTEKRAKAVEDAIKSKVNGNIPVSSLALGGKSGGSEQQLVMFHVDLKPELSDQEKAQVASQIKTLFGQQFRRFE